jgi:hypothetical protein
MLGSERFLCFFGNKSLLGADLSSSPSSKAPSESPTRSTPVPWLMDNVTSGDVPSHRGCSEIRAQGKGSASSLRHIVHMSPRNGKYCAGRTLRGVFPTLYRWYSGAPIFAPSLFSTAVLPDDYSSTLVAVLDNSFHRNNFFTRS